MEFIDIFQNLAFPAACTVFLAWLCWTQQQTINKFVGTLEKINSNLESLDKRIERLEDRRE